MQNCKSVSAATPLVSSPSVPGSGSLDVVTTAALGASKREVSRNQLGVINGCYVPCLLNIMGVVLFLRLSWGVGQLGVAGILVFFAIAEAQAVLTVLSLSAMVSNGNMRGGGSYFMISRALGPEFGGSIGILFYAAYCIGAAFYCTGFAEEVVGIWWNNAENHIWLVVGFASAVLFFCLLVALAGANYFTKVNVPLFFFQFMGTIIAMVALFQRGQFVVDEREGLTHYDWSWERVRRNWYPNCESEWGCFSFQAMFGILFPAATGIMEGANLSGDQKKPSFAIPYGTLSALLTSIVVYVLLIFGFAGAFEAYDLCNRYTLMQESSYGDFGQFLVIFGVLISASSSALGSLFGGSRVLQAISRDSLFPYTQWLGYGSSDGDEPRVAVVFTWAIAQLLCLIGSVNLIAPIATAIFCMSYATVNIACLLLEVSGTPNWRPEFVYFSWHGSLLGFIINLWAMFFVDYKFGCAALLCEMAVFVYLLYRSPATVWGDVTQSVIFHQVRKYLLKLDRRKHHSKLWRPSILLLVDNSDLALIDFCNNLKKGGLYIVGSVLEGDFEQFSELSLQIHDRWLDFINDNSIKAFPQVAVAPSARVGYENLMLLSGLGAMQPNTVVLPLIRKRKKKKKASGKLDEDTTDTLSEDVFRVGKFDSEEKFAGADDDENTLNVGAVTDESSGRLLKQMVLRRDVFADVPSEMKGLVVDSPAQMECGEYASLLRHILHLKKNAVVTCNFHKLHYSLVVSSKLQSRVEAKSKQQLVRGKAVSEWQSRQMRASALGVKSQAAFSDEMKVPLTQMAEMRKATDESNLKFVDVWLFAEDYTLDLQLENDAANSVQWTPDTSFPMLLMQLAHIILLNKVWTKQAKLRVILLTADRWPPERQRMFDTAIGLLRLKVDQIITLNSSVLNSKPDWSVLPQGEDEQIRVRLKKYYRTLNSRMREMSSETHLSLMALPRIVEASVARHWTRFFFDCLSTLTRDMPPTALVATGESIPVMTINV